MSEELGTATLKNGVWSITGKPHVLMRMKRVFAQLVEGYKDAVELSDTPDVARDLEWFMQRYPLELSKAHRKHLALRVAEYDKRSELVSAFNTGSIAPRAFELSEPARDYQKVAAEFFLLQRALLLADDMGVGKTVTSICALMDPATRPALVVLPRALQRQWTRQLARFAPALTVHTLEKASVYQIVKPGGLFPQRFPDVVLSTYAKLPAWATTLRGVVKSVIFDEMQELRRGTKTEKGRAAKALCERASYKLGLTGTPIYNLGGEFYWILEYLFPGGLGTRGEFLIEWCGAEDQRGRSALREPKAFGDYVRRTGMMVRRTRKDVGRELPGLTRIAHTIDCDPEPLREIESAAMRLARIIIEGGSGKKSESFLASQELSAMVRKATGVAKAPYVAEFVNLLLESEEKILLSGWHHDVYAIWKERLEKALGVGKVKLMTGEQTDKQRVDAEESFTKGDARVLIISNRLAAGLDGLQYACRTVCFGELDYSPMVHEQIITRVFRDGQTEPVAAYFPIADGGSDPIVADILQIKKVQIEGVRNPTMDIVEQLENDGGHVRRLAEAYLRKQRRRA